MRFKMLTIVEGASPPGNDVSPARGELRLATRGLATVALLKVNFDAGRDHIGMFEPFVLDTLDCTEIDAFTADAMRDAIRARHQLALPLNALRTLLARAGGQGFVRREAGRYFRTGKQADLQNLQVARERVEQRQQRLAEAFQAAAARRGVHVTTSEDALATLLQFLDQYHVAMALGGDQGLVLPEADRGDQDPTESRRRTMAVAAFLHETVTAAGDLADILQEMLEGFVLQNTLLLKDISTAARRFNNLHTIFDSGLLFGALGMRGVATQTATAELLALLKDTGAVLDVFEPTIREMRRILAVYEDKIGTPAGRAELYPTELTRHLLTGRATPSDIRTSSSLLERNIRALGFNIRDMPTRTKDWTLNEKELGKLLAEYPGAENVPRVVHDTDCVAGTLTYRRGTKADSFDQAVAVFVTGSGSVVRQVTDWYRAEGGSGLPPIIHVLALSNLAWLKRPASASKLKLHELVALCTAALRPTREAWTAFLAHLARLEESGELSSDEVTAIVASGLTDELLASEVIDEDSDAATLTEVVERVKESYVARDAAELEAATEAARASDARVQRLQTRLEERARFVATAASWCLAVALGLSLVVGTILTTANLLGGTRPGTLALVFAIVPLAVAGLCSLLWGFHVKAWRSAVASRIEQRLTSWLAPDL